MSEDRDDVYPKLHSRGVALLLTNINFDPGTGLPSRPGGKKDATNLRRIFEKLEYDVRESIDFTNEELLTKLHNVSKEDHTHNSSLVLVISTHGGQILDERNTSCQEMENSLIAPSMRDIIYCKDTFIHVRVILSFFTEKRCPTLAGKPKLFFVQACRGEKLAETIEVGIDRRKPKPPLSSLPSDIYKADIPIYKDCFLAYSGPPGFFAFRRRSGSWFITALCEILEKHHELDLLTLAMKVNAKVAFDFEAHCPSNPEMEGRKLMPWFASMLIKDFYFC